MLDVFEVLKATYRCALMKHRKWEMREAWEEQDREYYRRRNICRYRQAIGQV